MMTDKEALYIFSRFMDVGFDTEQIRYYFDRNKLFEAMSIVKNKFKESIRLAFNSDKYIVITFSDGVVCRYSPEEYTDYKYDRKFFIVIRYNQWIGCHNLNDIKHIDIATLPDLESRYE